MGGSIFSHKSSTIDGKDDMEPSEADIVDDLVVGPLEEGGIDGYYGNQPFRSEAGGEGHAMLLGDTNVKKRSGNSCANICRPVPILMAAVMATMRRSSRANSEEALTEDVGKGGEVLLSPLCLAGGKGERRCAVESFRFFLRIGVSLSLLRDHV